MKNIKISALFLLMGSFALNAQSLKSPDGKFEMNFQLKSGVPFYNLKYKGKTVVEDSKLGLRLLRDGDIQFASEIENKDQKGKNLDSGFTKTGEKFDSKNESWDPIMGEKKSYINHYNELAVTLNQDANDRHIIVKFRLFNEQLPALYPDLVIISLGTNESFDKQSGDQYFAHLSKMIQGIKEKNPQACVLIMTSPPSILHRKYKNTYIENYAALIGENAHVKNYAVWNLLQVLGGNKAINRNAAKGYMARDKVHYSK